VRVPSFEVGSFEVGDVNTIVVHRPNQQTPRFAICM
jgi:hypothetical protein